MTKRISMAMVAAHAGVSGQTVSRVANGSPRVDPDTRARVERAMAELGYKPNRAARALRTGRSRTIGVVAQTLTAVDTSGKLQAVLEAASQHEYAVMVITLGPGGDVTAALAKLAEQGVDGVIVLNTGASLDEAKLPAGLRVVAIEAPADERFDVVGADNAEGARRATAYLRDLSRGAATGIREVQHLAGPDGSFAAAERERGWRELMPDAAAPARGDWSAASGYDAVISSPHLQQASAIFVANDQMALGALRALADCGRRVPEDVAVVGFDDIAEAANFRPPLTTVRQDLAAIGERAVQTLVARIDDVRIERVDLSDPELVVRASA